MSQAFERLVEKAVLRKIRLHDLRHTHATLALKAGVLVKVVSERLGHESPPSRSSSTHVSSRACRPPRALSWRISYATSPRAIGMPPSCRPTAGVATVTPTV